MSPPRNLRALRSEGFFEITWTEDDVVRMPFQYLRGRCPCATCVNEFTGERMVDVNDIPTGIELVSAELVGNYALKITWSDQHDTGLYTWQNLRLLSNAREWEQQAAG